MSTCYKLRFYKHLRYIKPFILVVGGIFFEGVIDIKSIYVETIPAHPDSLIDGLRQ